MAAAKPTLVVVVIINAAFLPNTGAFAVRGRVRLKLPGDTHPIWPVPGLSTLLSLGRATLLPRKRRQRIT